MTTEREMAALRTQIASGAITPAKGLANAREIVIAELLRQGLTGKRP